MMATRPQDHGVRKGPAMSNAALEIKPITGTIGAEIGNVDFSRPLTAEQQGAITDALHDNLVIVFRNQKLTPTKQVEIARLFGKPAIMRYTPQKP